MKLQTLTKYLLFVTVLFSCSKDEVAPASSILEFTNLKVGNYWVYDWYEIDPDGNESSFNRRDSLYIEKDTTISNKTYLIWSGTFLGNSRRVLLFDSVNTIYIYPSLEILFTLNETVRVVTNYGPENDPIAVGRFSLESNPTSISVPAGSFECLNYIGLVEPLDPDYPYGERTISNMWANGTGLVFMQTQFYSSPNDLEMRLVRNGRN